MLTVTNASAVTIEDDLATGTTSPGETYFCTSSGAESQACFIHQGDWFSIRDLDADGLAAVIEWRLMKPVTNEVVRTGHVWNNSGSTAGWRYKNKDLTEAYYVSFRACEGSYARRNIQAGSCTPWHAKGVDGTL